MSTTTRAVPRLDPRTRILVRRVAAVLSAGCAVVYLLIGLGVARVVTGPEDGILFFGAMSAAAFALGAGLLWFTDRRVLWILGAVFQVLAILLYISVSEKRDPPFEAWGIALKIAQAAILGLLVVLILPTGVRTSRA